MVWFWHPRVTTLPVQWEGNFPDEATPIVKFKIFKSQSGEHELWMLASVGKGGYPDRWACAQHPSVGEDLHERSPACA